MSRRKFADDILYQEEKPRGWRVWKIDWHNDGQGNMVPRLFSPQQRMVWSPGINTAWCNQYDMKYAPNDNPMWHPSPQLYCNCGFYGVKDLSDVKEWGFGTTLPFIAGRVEFSGTIIQASKGWGSEFSQIVELHEIDSRCHRSTGAHKDFLSMGKKMCTCFNRNHPSRSSLPIDWNTVKQVAEFYGATLQTTKGDSCTCSGCKHVASMKKIGKRRYTNEMRIRK